MRCIKCGRKVKRYQVFCEECQEGMRDYPVAPGTPIQLPKRATQSTGKRKPSRSKKQVSPEEKVVRLRSSVRLLTLGLIAAVIAFAAVSLLLLNLLDQRDSQREIGQNYSTVSQDS